MHTLTHTHTQPSMLQELTLKKEKDMLTICFVHKSLNITDILFLLLLYFFVVNSLKKVYYLNLEEDWSMCNGAKNFVTQLIITQMKLQQLIFATKQHILSSHRKVFTRFHENFLIIAIVICHVTVSDHHHHCTAKGR